MTWDDAIAEFRVTLDDRSSPMPLHAQVAARLQELIETGGLPVGARIQNEVALAERLGISRPTMRRAMQHLVDRGLVVRKPGAGTEVVMPSVRRPVELTSLYDDLVRAGRNPSTDVLSLAVIPASDAVALARSARTEEAETLGIKRGAPVLTMTRTAWNADGRWH